MSVLYKLAYLISFNLTNNLYNASKYSVLMLQLILIELEF